MGKSFFGFELRHAPFIGRPGGSPHAVWWHKQVQMLQLATGMEVLRDAQQGTNMRMQQICICRTNASAASCNCTESAWMLEFDCPLDLTWEAVFDKCWLLIFSTTENTPSNCVCHTYWYLMVPYAATMHMLHQCKCRNHASAANMQMPHPWPCNLIYHKKNFDTSTLWCHRHYHPTTQQQGQHQAPQQVGQP